MNEQIAIKEALRNWLAGVNGEIQAEQIDDEFPLLSERVITSLQVTDLLLFIEQIRGTPVQLHEIQPSSFQNINCLYKTFFEGVNQCA